VDAYDFRARTLWPEIGRFGQEDPAGTGDSPNRYQALVGNWRWYVDPFGLEVFALADGKTRITLDQGKDKKEWFFTRKQALDDTVRFRRALRAGGWGEPRVTQYVDLLRKDEAAIDIAKSIQAPCQLFNWEFGNSICRDSAGAYSPNPKGPAPGEKRGRLTENMPECPGPGGNVSTVHCHPDDDRPDVDNQFSPDDLISQYLGADQYLLGPNGTLTHSGPRVVGEPRKPRRVVTLPVLNRGPYCFGEE
jgi:hypothetical protein